MPGPYPYAMIGVDDLNDPVTYHYEMRTPWGLMAQDLSVDIKILINRPESYAEIGHHLWSSTIATAISRDVSLDLQWHVRWKGGGLAWPSSPPLLSRGRQFGLPAGKAHTVIVQQHTGHMDNAAVRGLYLPSTPLNWQAGGMLTSRGWDSLMAWAHGLKMGLAGDELGGDLQHLIAYPHIVPVTLDNLSGVLFRRVKYLRVLEYTDKAPDWQGGLWP